MASRSRLYPLWRVVVALVSVFVLVRAVMYLVHVHQETAALRRVGLGRGCATFDYFGQMRSLTLFETDSVSDEALGCLKELTHLRDVDITGRGFTDRGLANLTGLTGLERVYLKVPPDGIRPGQETLTDEGLSYLRGLESLKSLTYVGARVTDAGMRHLEGLHNLEEFTLDCCEATDEGLKSLAKLDHLERLTLFNGPGMTGRGLGVIPNPSGLTVLRMLNVTDDGMRTIARFRNLRELLIGGPQLGVDGLKHLLVLSNLESVTIRGASVDKRAVETVVGKMTGLKELHIHDCPITEDAFKHLRPGG